MYVHKIILSGLRGLIGFERSYNADMPNIDKDLQQSSSGLYVNTQMHSLFTYENITAICEQFSKTQVRTWDAGEEYRQGDIVKEGSDIYQSLEDENTNHLPSTSTEQWRKTNLMSAYLRKLYDGAVLKLINNLFAVKKVNEVAKSLHANISLYEGVGDINGRIVKKGRLVGLRITLRNQDTVAMLNRIGLQVDQVQNPLPIYLYHSSRLEPVKTWELNQTKAVTFQWHKIAQEVIAFMSDDVNTAGKYYLCYYEDDLAGSAIRKDISFEGRINCGSCSESIANRQLYSKWEKFLSVQPFYVSADDLNEDKSLWNEDSEFLVEDTTFGLNIQMSIQCDVSNWLIENRNILADALNKQITVDILNEMTFSMRDNSKKERLAGLAAAALDNQENGQYGEVKQLQAAIKGLSFDFSGLSPACLPCNNAITGYKQKSVWGKSRNP